MTPLMDSLSKGQPTQNGSRAAEIVREAIKATAESAKAEQNPEEDASKSKDPARSESKGQGDLERLLTPFREEVKHVWIGWHTNSAINAFIQAIEEGKPMVLVIAEPSCNDCMELARNVMRCPAVERFAGDAVFAFSFPSQDLAARAMASSLSISAYPAITVLEPDPRLLLERGRINGYFDASKMGQHLDTILWKTPPRKDDKPQDLLGPKLLPSPVTSQGAMQEAAKRGLKYAPPTPECR
jgi:hypothetical protein